MKRLSRRSSEAALLVIVLVILSLGLAMVAVARQIQQGQDPVPAIQPALLPVLVVGLFLIIIHLILLARGIVIEQIILPAVALLFSIGLLMIYRLHGPTGVWQQLTRGFIPGMLLISILILFPRWIEWIRQHAVPVSLLGLALPLATAVFGVVDESGARLALKLGPLPAIQTSEVIKIILVIFLAWYIDQQQEEVEGRARPLFAGLRMPAIAYFIPGTLFVVLATLALVGMSDFGAVLILGSLFIAMLYAGFDTRIFLPVAAIGLGLAAFIGLFLSFTWEVPTVIRYRFLAFLDPWSNAMILVNGQPTGITISAGPGYQIQQAIYAIVAGGITGTGLGFGSPQFVPLAASDFIYAAIVEEMGAAIGIAVLALFIILILRILRIAVLLPRGQVFERLLLIGIAIHFFTQVFVMVGGTLNLLPLTGITIPFMSQGGMALLVNLAEVGLVLGIAQRVETPA